MQSEFTACRNKTFEKKQSRDANFSWTFVGKTGEVRKVTSIAGSKMDKLLSNLT